MRQLIVSIPHSGEKVPAETPWLQGLPESVLMCDVDRYVEDLYRGTLSHLEIQHVTTEWHRYVVDLNRLAEDHDASTVEGSPNPAGQFRRGIHWAHTTKHDVLLAAPISMRLHQQLILKYFDPFHQNLRETFQRARNRGVLEILHLDLHSMPSVGTSEHRDPGQRRADVVISDNKGKSTDPEFFELVCGAYQKAGFSVAKNWPYFGGRITEFYGRPSEQHHAIQVELNRALYMDETTKKARRELWPPLEKKLEQALQQIQGEFLR